MKRASALLKSGNVYIQGYSETASGVWIADGPVPQIGKHIRDAFSHSTRGIQCFSVQAAWKAIQAPMLKAVGANTWTALADGARAVGLECINEIMTIIPSANYAANGGTELRAQAVKSELQADDIGDKILTALNASS